MTNTHTNKIEENTKESSNKKNGKSITNEDFFFGTETQKHKNKRYDLTLEPKL